MQKMKDSETTNSWCEKCWTKRILRYKLARFRYSDNAKARLRSDIVLKIFFLSFYPTIVGIFSYLCILEYKCLYNLS